MDGSPGIFISYRRDDTAHPAARLRELLAGRYGSDQVFMDTGSIGPGRSFRKVIFDAVGSCSILLALIGPRWHTDAEGNCRIDDPRDLVRLEIEAALKRSIRVVPILFDRVGPLHASNLPDSIAELASLQALKVSADSFARDLEPLTNILDKMFTLVRSTTHTDLPHRPTQEDKGRPPSSHDSSAEPSGRGAAGISRTGPKLGPGELPRRPDGSSPSPGLPLRVDKRDEPRRFLK